MKEEDRLESLKTSKLSLSYWDTFFYFFAPIFLTVVIPIAILFGPMLHESRDALTQRDIIITIIFVLVGLWFFSIQINSLKMKEVRTVLSRQQLREIIENTSVALKGNVKEVGNGFMILYVRSMRVTILIDTDRVLINSIESPKFFSYYNSPLSFSGNLEKTTNRFVIEIRKANVMAEWEMNNGQKSE